MIKSIVVADSLNEHKKRIVTKMITFPRFILAELNTHRMFSRNSASSRAIPFKKMLRSVLENPFIPIAWQKDHSGMQGSQYLNPDEKHDLSQFIPKLLDIFNKEEDKELIDMYTKALIDYANKEYTLVEWWLLARDKVVEAAVILSLFGTTKQLCNRLLEPFMWHTVIVTSTEWENFFALRSPMYTDTFGNKYKSKKDMNAACFDGKDYTSLDWMIANKGQAEIHMMALTEAMWDSYNESIPTQLKAGEWHIPFGDRIDEGALMDYIMSSTSDEERAKDDLAGTKLKAKIKIAVARCARVSYTVVGEENKPDNYNNDIILHDRLAASGHWSPFEHVAQAMDDSEMFGSSYNEQTWGWSGNFRGFVQYRKTFANENISTKEELIKG